MDPESDLFFYKTDSDPSQKETDLQPINWNK